MLILLSIPFKFPSPDFKIRAAGTQAQSTVTVKDHDSSEAMTKSTFWILWFFIIEVLTGLMAIGIATPFNKELKLSTALSASALQLFAIFNFAGNLSLVT